MTLYTGLHRDDMSRPDCTCEQGYDIPWTRHEDACAITIEVNTRLHKGVGGTRDET